MSILDYMIHRTNATRERVRQEVIAGKIPRWITNSRSFPYIRQVIVSTPGWVEREELAAIKERSQCLTALTGIEHHVAHIIPLNHPRMCGLTVPWNLQIKHAKVNLAESNRVVPDEQMNLFGPALDSPNGSPTTSEFPTSLS